MISGLVALSILLPIQSAPSNALNYVQTRKKFGVYGPATEEAKASFVGAKMLEIRGTYRGSCQYGDRQGILLEPTQGEATTVAVDVVPVWITDGMVLRCLVRATRETETSGLEASYIAAAPDDEVSAIERKFARETPKPRSKPVAPSQTGSPYRRASINWNLLPSDATPFYAAYIHRVNPRLPVREAYRIATGIVGFSMRYGVDARLIMAMVMVESGFNPSARSRAGAMGLGQLMPGTARGIGVANAYDTAENLFGTVKLVRRHLEDYNRSTGDAYRSLVLTIAAYNAGPGAVRRHGGVPPYRETQRYVRKVMSLYYQLAGYA
jgi:soluble lytic murein transglycosylase-like protein